MQELPALCYHVAFITNLTAEDACARVATIAINDAVPSNHLSSHLARRNAGVFAVVADTRLKLLRLLAVVVRALVFGTDVLDAGGAGVGDSGGIAVVGLGEIGQLKVLLETRNVQFDVR